MMLFCISDGELVIFCSMHQERSQKPFFFPLIEIMLFKFEYNLNIDNI